MKRIISYSLSLLLCLGQALGATSCRQDNVGRELSNPSATIGEENVDFTASASVRNIAVLTGFDGWKATSNQSWCSVVPQGRSLRIEVAKSDDPQVREAIVTLTFGGLQRTLTVRQLGTDPTILVSKSIYSIPASGSTIELEVTANVAVALQLPEWITDVTTSARSAELASTTYQLSVAGNPDAQERSGEILVVEQDLPQGRSLKQVRVSVAQEGTESYKPAEASSLPDDEKITIVSGEASSFQAGSDITKAFDGDKTTGWHSSWANQGANYFPITVTLNFAQQEDVDYLIYHPRTSGRNGLWKEVDIEYSLDGTTFTHLLTKDFKGVNSATRVTFEQPVRAQSFRFIIRSGAGDRQGFAQASEIEFYKKSASAFDATAIFTDETCSELLPSVTDAQIQGIKEPFYRNLAFYLKSGRYAREFRIAEYKPYLHPDVEATTFKRNAYSLLDNPTGIYVESGETLVVFVGDTYGHEELALRVINFDTPGADGFKTPTAYPLFRGVNKLKISAKGLVYVMYHTRDAQATLKPIKIHFASGGVNGYFDSQNPAHEGRFSELLAGAKSKYFDVLGKYAHLTFPTSRFRDHTAGQGKELIDIYDEMTRSEWELHGYFKYNRIPSNRMYLHVMYTSFMYATSYHTAYNDSTLPTLTDPSKLADNIWGPAHELGHVNQTFGLKWLGMTETTNNIASAYVQTYAFNKPCRLQAENLSPGVNRYTKAWNLYLVPETRLAHVKTGPFERLVPFWQLELYVGKVKGNTPTKRNDKGGFYPDVYEYLRQDNNLTWNDGKQQIEFTYLASLKSGYDLTKFFEAYGFYVPIDETMTDYRTARMTITQDMINEVKNRIASLNLPEPDGAIEYITDNTADLYSTYPAVVEGSATRDGRKLTFDNWQNVVAYEVYNADGKLLYVGDGYTPGTSDIQLLLPTDWEDGFVVKAVSARGDRTIVSL